MTVTIWRGDAAPIAQVSFVTPADIELGDTFTMTINRKDVTVTATVASVAALVGLLVTAVNASTIPEFMELTATAGTTDGVTTHLVLAGPSDGKPFTLTSTSSDAGNLAVEVAVSQAGSEGSNEIQRVAIPGAATGGTFTLSFDGQTTGNLTYDESAADIETAMELLSTVNAVTVTGSDGGPWLVEFVGTHVNADVALMTGDGANITKGASAYPVVVTTAVQGDGGQNEKQQVTLPGSPTGGTFTLSFDGQVSATIAYNASAATVETALEGLSNITAGDVVVTGDAGGPYAIEFASTYANTDVSPLVADGSSLTGVASVSVTVATEGATSTNAIQRLTFDAIATPVAFVFTNHLGVFGAQSAQFSRGGSATSLTMVLEDMESIGSGNVQVTKLSDLLYNIEFIGDLAGNGQELIYPTGTTAYITDITVGGDEGWDEVQVITLAGNPTGGTFTLSFRGQTTAAIAYGATAAAVESAMELLSTITTDDLTVAGNDGGPWTVTFGGTLATQDLPAMTGNGTSLTGGTLSIGLSQSATAATNEAQIATIYGSPAGGAFTLSYGGNTTAGIAYDATAAAVESALELLGSIDAVSVTGDAGGPWAVEFQGTLAGTNVVVMTSSGASLSGAVVDIDVTQSAAETVDEIQIVTLDGSPTGGTFTLTFDSQTTAAIVYNASASGVQTALEALSSVDVGEIALSGIAGGPWTVLFQSGLGAQDVSAITGGATNLTSTGTQTFVTTADTSPTGPNWFSEIENWTENALPVDGDTIVFEESSVDCLYGISQSSITPAAIDIRSSYTGKIGLTPHTGLYYEYRDTYLALGDSGDAQKITITIGNGYGSSSGRIKLDTGDAETELLVLNTGTAESDMPAVLWKGTHASNIARVYKGSFGAAVYAGETATIAELEVGYLIDQEDDSEVVLGDGVTLVDVEKTGGSLLIGGVSGSAVTTFEQLAGETIVNGSDGIDALDLDGGTLYYNSTGTIGGAPKVIGDGVLDFSRDMRAKTVTNPIELHGDESDVIDPFQVVANLRIDYNETTRMSKLGQNVRLTRGAPS